MKRSPILLNALLLAAMAALLLTAACPASDPPAPAGEKTVTAAQKGAGAEGGKVARIVFVGQKDCCECTRTRIDDTWKVLEGALADRKDIPVERLQLDVNTLEVEALGELGSLMVAPGIYFLDASGGLVELLQGEVEPKAVATALAR